MFSSDDENESGLSATYFINLECSARGRHQQCIELLSLMELKIPESVIQSMKMGVRGKGRGRFLQRSADHYSSLVGKSNVPVNLDMAGVTTPSVPFTKVLSTANQRFKYYDTPTHNAARKSSDVDIYRDCDFPPLPGSAAPSAPGKAVETNSNSVGDILNRSPASTNTHLTHPNGAHFRQVASMLAQNCSSSGNGELASAQLTQTNPSDVGQSELTDCAKLRDEKDDCHKTLCDSVQDDDCEGVSDKLGVMKDKMADDDCNKKLVVNCSTPKSTQTVDLTDWADDSNSNLDSYTIRIEDMPPSVTRQQLIQVIDPYCQVLNIKLELRISGGVESLAADIQVADGSIAEFIVSCLDNAETVFEGAHDPVKCYVK